MFGCFACDLTFDQNFAHVQHVELCHKLPNNFTCLEQDCSKQYAMFNSYKRHRLWKHAPFLEKKVEDVSEETFTIDFEAECIFHDESKRVFLQEELEVKYVSSSDETDDLFDVDKLLLSEKITKQSLGTNSLNEHLDEARLFVAKLYKHPDLSRKRVNEIADSIKRKSA